MNYKSNSQDIQPMFGKGAIISTSVVGVAVIAGFFLYPKYRVWAANLAGEAEFVQAEQNRKIAVLEAQAKLDSAKSLALAEVERAKGVAEANRIIGESLKDNDGYLQYLWIQNLEGGNNAVVYVPTEAGLPILEAGRDRGQKNH